MGAAPAATPPDPGLGAGRAAPPGPRASALAPRGRHPRAPPPRAPWDPRRLPRAATAGASRGDGPSPGARPARRRPAAHRPGRRRVLPSSGSRCRQSARFLRQPRIPAAAPRPGPASPARPRPRPDPGPGPGPAGTGGAAQRWGGARGHGRPPRAGVPGGRRALPSAREPAAEQRRSPRARAFRAGAGPEAGLGAAHKPPTWGLPITQPATSSPTI